MSDTKKLERTMTYNERQDKDAPDFASPNLFIGLECACPLSPAGRFSIGDIEVAVIGRGDERAYARYSEHGRAVLRLAIPDQWLSSSHVTISRTGRGLNSTGSSVSGSGESGWAVADVDSKNGTMLNGTRIKRAQLSDGDLIEAGNTLVLFRAAVNRDYRDNADTIIEPNAAETPALATLNADLTDTFEEVRRVADSNVAIMITGETGTGKEMLARAIHKLSRRSGEFIAINCGALSPTLVESELFGHRKGAFSGATEDRPGLVRAANGGTLFLDEIAELPESSQVKLLRVLQEQEVTPVGSTKPISVNVRILSATHQDLEARVKLETFRQDLLARLLGFEVELPRLCDRREDIGLLIAFLLPRIAGEAAADITFKRSAGRALLYYDWPLNIRELHQVLTAAIALAGGEPIELKHLPKRMRRPEPGRQTHQRKSEPSADSIVAELAKETNGENAALEATIRGQLAKHAGNVSAVSRELGCARVQVRRWCTRFGIKIDAYR